MTQRRAERMTGYEVRRLQDGARELPRKLLDNTLASSAEMSGALNRALPTKRRYSGDCQ